SVGVEALDRVVDVEEACLSRQLEQRLMRDLRSSTDAQDIDGPPRCPRGGAEAQGVDAGRHVAPPTSEHRPEGFIGAEHEEDMVELRQHLQGALEERHVLDLALEEPTEPAPTAAPQ